MTETCIVTVQSQLCGALPFSSMISLYLAGEKNMSFQVIRLRSGVHTNFHGGGFTQWHMVVICIWYARFVTSQFDVIFMFPNQRFREIC